MSASACPVQQFSQEDAIFAEALVPFDDVSEWVQWMPGGEHSITATQRGKKITTVVKVTPTGASAVQAALEDYLHNERQRPFFDFNHDGKTASAWPLEFAWRETPEPGIYARVEWSGSGKTAIRNKDYRAFSPSFFLNPDKQVAGAPMNMGALVNDPAFRSIAPLWARRAGDDSNTNDGNNDTTMNGDTQAAELAALQAKIVALEQENAEVKARDESNTTELSEAIKAKDAELEEVRNKFAEMERLTKERARRDAEAIVASAVTRGVIPPKDTAAQEKWRELIVADPKNADLLAGQPGKPAVAASRVASHTHEVRTIRPDTNDVLRAYINAGTPLDKGMIYQNEIKPLLDKGERIPFERYAARGAEISASNALGTAAGNLISQRVLDLMVSRRPMLLGIASDFSAEQAVKGQTIYTRTVGVPAVQNFGSGAEDSVIADVTVQMANHKEIHHGFTPAEYLTSNRNFIDETAEALAIGLGNHMVDAVAALITAAFTNTAITGAANTKDFSDVVKGAKALNVAGAPDINRSMWINSDFAEALLNDEVILEYVDRNTSDAYGRWRNVAGFANIWEYPALPGNSINLIGFGFHRNALVLCTRVAANPAQYLGAPYPGSLQVITDPVTGFSVLTDRWIDQATRKVNNRLDVLYGCARGVVTAGQLYRTSV